MEEKKRLVSIALATYNGEKYLNEQIQSLVDQNYRPLEIIVVDDRSTDNTWNIINDWKIKYPDLFTIVRNEQNLGFNQNFSKAIGLCNGQYIAMSDQDDIWVANKISTLVDLFESDPEITLVHHKDDHIIDGKIQKQVRDKYYRIPYTGNDPKSIFYSYQMGGHSMMLNRTIVQDLLPIPDGILYDWWILLIAVWKGKVAYCDDDLVHFRYHSASAYYGNKKRDKDIAKDIDNALSLFQKIAFCSDDQEFLGHLKAIYHRHASEYNKKFDWRLFWYFLKNRNVFFGKIEGPNKIETKIFQVRLCRIHAKL